MKTVFIVDDNDTNLMAAKIALEGTYKTYALQSAVKMFDLAEKILPDLILLDIDMPDMDGFKAMEILKENNRLKSIPVIFLTAMNDPDAELHGLEMGAADYIVKPFSKPVLIKRIETQIEVSKSAEESPQSQDTYDNQSANFPKGSYIVLEEKKVPNQFYFIMKGKVSVMTESHVQNKKKLEELGPGDFFGAISAMSGNNQIETAIALTNVETKPVRCDQFNQFAQENPQMVKKMILEFSKKISYFNDLFAGLALKKNNKADTNSLFNIAKYYSDYNQHDYALYVYNKFLEYCPQDFNADEAKRQVERLISSGKKEMKYKELSDSGRIYPKNALFYSEGEPGEEVFFIKSGMVKLFKIVDNREILLAVMTKGDIFGEMAFLENRIHSDSACAYENSEVMVVNRANFETLIKSQPLITSRLAGLFANRLWIINKKISNTQISDPIGRMIDMLFIQMEMKGGNKNERGKFEFDFGLNDLNSMVGLSPFEANIVSNRFIKLNFIEIVQNKIAIKNIGAFLNHAKNYRSTR
ncbi:MAG: cyclic nucleotide-binding domain-containing protein [Treponema sp.]|nr:cyclic nucleotide-binding domain-containing protein [Treponema sp.]